MRANFSRSRPNVHVRIAVHLPRPRSWPHFVCWAIHLKTQQHQGQIFISSTECECWVCLFSMVNVSKHPSPIWQICLYLYLRCLFHLFSRPRKWWTIFDFNISTISTLHLLVWCWRKKWQQNKSLFSLKWWFSFSWRCSSHGIHNRKKKKKNKSNSSHPKVIFHITNSRFWHSWRLPAWNAEGGCKSRPIVSYSYSYTWNPFVLYFWRSTPQNKVFSNQNKGHLGSS